MPIKKILNEKIEHIQDRCIDLETREVWLHSVDMSGSSYEGVDPGIEYMMATKIIKNLHLLRKQSTTANVIIHMFTGGGDLESGFAIYDTILSMPYNVTIICYTCASSMSSVIFQAGNKRIMMPHSHFMFHMGYVGFEGDSKTVYSTADFTKKQDKQVLDIYIKRAGEGEMFSGKSNKYIKKTIIDTMNKKGDVYLTPNETIMWGFADDIFTKWPRTLSWRKAQ